MKIGRLNHVAIAVPSIEKCWETYKTFYGVEDKDITPIKEMASQGIRFSFINLENSQLELIEPLNEASPIAKFLEKYPNGGQHHICFEVDNIYDARDDMVAKGAQVLGEPRIGAHGTLIIFVHPKNSNGVLVELMESPKDH